MSVEPAGLPPSKPIRILIVDDEPVVRDSLGGWFTEEGYSVDIASSGKEALEKIARQSWDIFLIDIRMPGMDGLEAERKILGLNPGATVIIMTAYASIETAVAAMKEGAYDYIVKPFDPEALEHLVRNAAERKRLLSENEALRRRVDEDDERHRVIGTSAAMEEVRRKIGMLAASGAPVLIEGESGAGKELIARAIHARSPRRYMPFVVANCAGLSTEAIVEDLLGHEKGVGGALCRKKGKMEVADGGTLFIDEVGDLEPRAQVVLLRALEDRKIEMPGRSEPVDADFRLIAAAGRDLRAKAAAGAFRADLLDRLAVFPIAVPPLRERREDIPLLADHFLRLHARSMNLAVPRISAAAMEAIRGHDWPRNARELKNVMERALLVSRGEEILPCHLALAAPAGGGAPGAGAEDERQRIERCLRDAGGNLGRAASLLGIDRASLFEKMKNYGLGSGPGPAAS